MTGTTVLTTCSASVACVWLRAWQEFCVLESAARVRSILLAEKRGQQKSLAQVRVVPLPKTRLKSPRVESGAGFAVPR